MTESTSGVIKDKKTSANTMEALLYFMYNENLDENKITGDLLIAADYYNVSDLVSFCVNYLTENLTDKNAIEVMVSTYLTNQRESYQSACRYVHRRRLEGQTL